MKKINFKGKLSLNKETISKLQENQMMNVIGGNGEECQTNGARCSCSRKSCNGNDLEPQP
ncbi:class I lanthipeptide [Mesonia sp.]|uniref:class I lanthipeptide n=1 Tax=Mesonia sp. TaxID=1960830 RepID=UPI000C8CDBA2|nr:class I lanthipeptide [Mesonia sp.]MAN25761.1 rSAM-modified peptide [Mesonia sp.]|tara:strand:- start:12868 stop:13047 length:180 start_codon:yes stop_codon:yes gene_type:complete